MQIMPGDMMIPLGGAMVGFCIGMGILVWMKQQAEITPEITASVLQTVTPNSIRYEVFEHGKLTRTYEYPLWSDRITK